MKRVDQTRLRRMLERGEHEQFVIHVEDLCAKLVRSTASNGFEQEDLMQEARTAAYRAAVSWRADSGANPLTYALMVIQRELWKVTKQQMTAGRIGQHSLKYLDQPVGSEDGATTRGALMACKQSTPHEIVERRDTLRAVVQRLGAVPKEAGDRQRRAAVRGALGDQPMVERFHIYVDRDAFPDKRKAIAQAGRMRPGCLVEKATARKLLDGRERAPQGRRTLEGKVGDPVWRIDMTREIPMIGIAAA